VRGIAAGLLGPLLGPFADHKLAPRIMLPMGTFLSGLSFMLVRWADTPLEYYLIYGVLGALGSAIGGGQMIDAISVKWFMRKRPKAVMWASLGTPLGVLFFPPVITAVISLAGWRMAWFWIGIGVIVLLVPLTLLVRTRPEHLGMLPDGDQPGAKQPAGTRRAQNAPSEVSFTRREALRTASFWLLMSAGAFGVFGAVGFQAQWVPFAQDRGFSHGTATTLLTVYGIFAIANRFILGAIASRFALRYVFAGQAFLTSLSIVFMLFIDSLWMLYLWAALQGLTQAGFFQLMSLTAARYFGRDHIGAIRGTMQPMATMSIAISPLVLASLRDRHGNYDMAFALVAGTWFITSMLVLASKVPRKQPTPGATPAATTGAA
jgi:MFS family permease